MADLRYTLFGRGTGLRVSRLAIGSAVFGNNWGYGSEPDEVARMLAIYAEAGGNFLDTADFYQGGQSEELFGAFLAGQRDRFVLSSKYTLGTGGSGPIGTGNSRLNMANSVEGSLRRLKTDRIDIFWVHMADGMTSSEEIMRGLDDLVRAGKIRYIGLSNFPAWRVARAATIAELRGWAPLIGIQIEHSLVQRAGDRDLLPMARALGIGVAAWSPLGGGMLTGKYRRGEEGRATAIGRAVHDEDGGRKTATLNALDAVAHEVGATPLQVALAWLMAQNIVPIMGPRTSEQLKDNLAAADVTLSADQLDRLDRASAIALEYPHDFLASDQERRRMMGGPDDQILSPYPPVA